MEVIHIPLSSFKPQTYQNESPSKTLKIKKPSLKPQLKHIILTTQIHFFTTTRTPQNPHNQQFHPPKILNYPNLGNPITKSSNASQHKGDKKVSKSFFPIPLMLKLATNMIKTPMYKTPPQAPCLGAVTNNKDRCCREI